MWRRACSFQEMLGRRSNTRSPTWAPWHFRRLLRRPTSTSVACVGGNVEVAGQGLISSPPYYYYYDSWYWTKGSGIVPTSRPQSPRYLDHLGRWLAHRQYVGLMGHGYQCTSGQIVGTYGYNSYGGVGGGFSYTIGNAAVRMKSPNLSFRSLAASIAAARSR